MVQICLHCRELAVEYDEEEDIKVCANCGTISEETSILNYDNFQENSEITGRGNWRERRHYYNKNTREEKAKECLQEHALKLNIPQSVVEQISSFIVDQVYRYTGILARDRSAVVAGCVFIICRQNNMLLTLRNVAQITETDVFLLGRIVKMIKQLLAVEIKPLKPDDFVPMFLVQFKVEQTQNDCEKLATDLLKLCEKFLVFASRPGMLLAAVAVYCCVECKQGKPERKLLLKVCSNSGIVISRFDYYVNYLRKELILMAEEVIPWVDKPIKHIAKIIPDIIEYQNCIEGYRPSWQQRKEKILTARRLRIRQVKEKIKNGSSDASEERPLSYKSRRNILNRKGVVPCDADDKIIETLLCKGFTEEQLMEGNLETLLADTLQGPEADQERTELDAADIPDDQLHTYIKSPAEVKLKTQAASMFSLEPEIKKKYRKLK